MKTLRSVAVALAAMVIAATFGTGLAAAQSWQPLTHQPSFDAGAMLLLTDGTVMVVSEPNCLSCTNTDFS